MKILHFIPTLGSGGAERQLYLLCRETADEVEHFVTAVASEGRWARPLRDAGIPVTCLGSALRDPRVLIRLRREVSRVEPDVVHCWLPSMNVAGALAAWPVPVIASVRNVDDWKPWLYRLADRLIAPFWGAVVANSYAGATETARAAGIDPDSVHVIPNGIQPRLTGSKPRGAEKVVLTACRLVRQKRVDRVLLAARELPEFEFRIAGDGPERRELEKSAPANVSFLGELADVSAEYDAAGLFMLTSDREGMSNSLLEAMQAGCVPVVTRAGDNARLVENGVSGRVVSGQEELAAAVRECVESWKQMNEAARLNAARYTVPAMAGQTLSLYRSMARATAANPLPRLH